MSSALPAGEDPKRSPSTSRGTARELSPSGSVAPASWQVLASAAIVMTCVAVAVRWPWCGESLWVDELHTAWTVEGSLADVAPRAAAGNQTPWYFWGMWLWMQITGGSDREAQELLLRLPSVLAVAATCGLLVIAATRLTGRLVIGLLAGGLLAVESNALFFGTEARPYGIVMLLTTLAAWGWAESLGQTESLGQSADSPVPTAHAAPVAKATCPRWWRWLIWSSTFAAILMHPTAGLSVAILALVAVVWSGGTRRRDAVTTAVGSAVACAFALLINGVTVRQVWQVRHNWLQFGVPESPLDLWTMWPWEIALVPVVVSGVLWVATRSRTESAQTSLPEKSAGRLVGWLLSVVLLVTCVCWSMASLRVVPIWHRRYIIGVLPLLCWAGAAAWTWPIHRIARRVQSRFAVGAVCAVLLAAGILGLVWRQESWRLWQPAPQRAVPPQRAMLRGENWRGAIEWLNARRKPHEPVYVGAELIESDGLHEFATDDPRAETLRRYLLFPVESFYPVDGAAPLGHAATSLRRDLQQMLEQPAPALSAADPPDRVRVRWLIYRLPEPYVVAAYNAANSPTLASPAIAFTTGTTQAFPGITIVRLQTDWPDSE